MKLKKILLISGVTVMTAVLLTGCGKKNNNNKAKEFKKDIQEVVNDVRNEVNDARNELNEARNEVNAIKETVEKESKGYSRNYNYEIKYEDEEYITKNEEGKIVFKNERNVPTVESSSNPDAAKKIEKSLREISDKNWKEVNDSADEYTASGMKAYDTPYGVSYMMKTFTKNNKVVTIEADQTGGMGGVSWTAIELYNYDSENGNLLTLGDIAKDESNLKQFLKTKTKEYIASNFKDILQRDIDSEIDKVLGQSGNYGFAEDKFLVILPKYSIGSGADGVKSVEINKSEINEFLVDKYKM